MRSRSMVCLAVVASLSLCSRPLRADDAKRVTDDPRVADAARAWMEWVDYQAAINRVPGVSVGLVHDQEMIATGAFGWASREAGRARHAVQHLFDLQAIYEHRGASTAGCG